MRKPTEIELRNARAEFRELLRERTPEAAWQTFFAANPFVLSRALPLRLEPADLLPLGRPGLSEPDFVIHPGSNLLVPVHGLIELKTHFARVTTVARKNVLSLTRDAATAIRQLQVYDRNYNLYSPTKRCVTFSSASYLFVVMGMQEEFERLGRNPDLIAQVADLLPPGIRLLGFDEILAAYEQGLARTTLVLLPREDFRTRPSILEQLAQATAHGPDLHSLSPREFEQLLGELLSGMGMGPVESTPLSSDGGRDFLAYLDTNLGRQLCLVEAKKYRPERKVGIDVTRSLYGTLCAEQATSAMLVTTSSFTADARAFQTRHRHQLFLKDHDDIVEWIRRSRPRKH